MGLRIRQIFILIIALTINSTYSYAGWQGPSVILTGTWGNGDTTFGIEYGDMGTTFPSLVAVLFNGKIVILDEINERQIVYNNDGTLFKVVPWKISKDGIKKINPEYILYNYYNVEGYTSNNQIWNGFDDYILKAATGEIITKTKTRPADIGIINTERIASKQYRITIQYPDKVWSTIVENATDNYIKDINGNVYSYKRKQVIRFNDCGKKVAILMMPEDIRNVIPDENPDLDPEIELKEKYGKPLIAPYGDVYTWKYTPDKYSIIKWTWVDDPNTPIGSDAPANLKAASSTTGLYLTWTASPQDPGCVSSYEVSRSATAGGTYSVIATVDKSILNYTDTTAEVGATYYYKLRAKSGSDFSPYTAEASGKR